MDSPQIALGFNPWWMKKEIIRLAIPNIISNISVPLLSSVDTALMGQQSLVHLGAVGIGSMIFSFVYWNFGFLRMGTTGMTAQAYGAKDQRKTIMTLARAIVIALFVSICFLIFQNPLGDAAFTIMKIIPEQMDFVQEYFNIRIWAAPASLMLFAIFGWLFGMQNPIYPLILTILINGINIVLSYVFVQYWDWGVAGVAWGTVIAQYVGLFAGFILLAIKYRSYFSFLNFESVFEIAPFKSFLNVNKDIFIRTVFLTFAFGFFYRQSSVFGPEILAVNIILEQFIAWMSYGIDGFAYATESLVGKYFGAKETDKIKKVIRLSFIFSFGMAILYSLVFFVFEVPLIQVFSKDDLILNLAHEYMIWIFIFPIVATSSYIWDGIFIGYTASKEMRNSMAIALTFYLIVFFLLENALGNHGLWIALLSFVFFRALIQWVMYRKFPEKYLAL